MAATKIPSIAVKHPKIEAIKTPFAPLLVPLSPLSGELSLAPIVGCESTTFVGCGPFEVSPPVPAPPPPPPLPAAAGVAVGVLVVVVVVADAADVGVAVGGLWVRVAVGVAVGGPALGVSVGVVSKGASLMARAACTSLLGANCMRAAPTNISKPSAATSASNRRCRLALLPAVVRPPRGMPEHPRHSLQTPLTQ